VKQCLCLLVLFCSTEVSRTSFVRQLEADFHIDTSLDVVSQLSVCDLLSLFFLGGWRRICFDVPSFLNGAVFFCAISGSSDVCCLYHRWMEVSFASCHANLMTPYASRSLRYTSRQASNDMRMLVQVVHVLSIGSLLRAL
jgi:hypothetical protein